MAARERNESPADKARERIIMRNYATCLGLEELNIHSYRVDAALYHPDTRALQQWVEVKWRNHPRTDSYLLGCAKLLKLYQLKIAWAIPAYFIVATSAHVLRYRVDERKPFKYERRMSGRHDRGQPGDWEPCVFIPCAEFEDISNWNITAGVTP